MWIDINGDLMKAAEISKTDWKDNGTVEHRIIIVDIIGQTRRIIYKSAEDRDAVYSKIYDHIKTNQPLFKF